MKKRSLQDLVDPVAKTFVEYIASYEKIMLEIKAYIMTIPIEEFSQDKIEVFLKELTAKILETIPNTGWIADIRQMLPAIIRTNFMLGIQYSNAKESK